MHPWSVTPAEARDIQSRLRSRVITRDRLPGRLDLIAGADVALDLTRRVAIAGVILYRFPGLTELQRVSAERPLTFPYVPGLLSFREIPALLDAFAKLTRAPGVIFYDGHGVAHPRRFGIASHLGVLLDTPTIGCAKSRLIGTHRDPALRAASTAPLTDGGEVIGTVLRTRAGVKPIYISIGHRISLPRAVELALAVCDGFRIPRPTRQADRFVESAKRAVCSRLP